MYIDTDQETNQSKLISGDNHRYYGLRDRVLLLRCYGISIQNIADQLATSTEYVLEILEGEL